MPDVEHASAVAEVTALFEQYEADLVANDVDAMDAVFLDDDRVLRYGIADMQEGIAAVRSWRRAATPVPATRRITSRHVLALTADVVAVDITFVNGDDDDHLGRQSQTWVRTPEGWRIVRAHVSRIAWPPSDS
jgi:ketosteroid isomerase-like protein